MLITNKCFYICDMANERESLTITLSKPMVNFIHSKTVNGLFVKTRIKPTQLIEVALEEYFAKHGHSEDFENFKAAEAEIY